jgi:DNA-binding response OmpR family regulator
LLLNNAGFEIQDLSGFFARIPSRKVSTAMKTNRILLAEDKDDVRVAYQEGLENRGFAVVPAASVTEALRLISTENFDVLLSDLYLPDASDGFTVVNAMRHAQPSAVTLVLSNYPVLQAAMTAILLQADQVLVKPIGFGEIADIIQKKLSNPSTHTAVNKERAAAILERDLQLTIQNWMSRVEHTEELTAIPLTYQDRMGHLPLLLNDLVGRLRLPPDARTRISRAAREHGILRRAQGYTVPMVVEESRILQVSIFNTLQNNLGSVDFGTVLLDVMTIADEVDSQLKQAMLGFMETAAAKAAR